MSSNCQTERTFLSDQPDVSNYTLPVYIHLYLFAFFKWRSDLRSFMQSFRIQDAEMADGKLRKAVHGGRGKYLSGSILDFSASLNPVPPKIDWIPDPRCLSAYPDDGYHELKSVISRIFKRPVEEICVGNGSIEVLRAFCMAKLGPGKTYKIDNPTFGEYALSAELTKANLARGNVSPTVRFLCNPNNPTGHLMTRQKILEALDTVSKEGTTLFLDEAFIELADTQESVSDIRDPDLFVLRSLTKCFSVPGIRFGYGFGDPDLIEKIELLRAPWSVNAFAETFALAALEKLGDLEESREYIRKEREYLAIELTELGFSVEPSSTNFILVHVHRNAGTFCDRLLRKGILVRDCASFGLPESIRVAVMKHEENQQLIQAITECLR